MEMQKDNNEKRRRKIISRPVLVRSVKPGQITTAATYSKEHSSFAPIWKS